MAIATNRLVATVAFHPVAEAEPSTSVADLVLGAAHAATLSRRISNSPLTGVPREAMASAKAAPNLSSAPLV